MGKRKYTAYSLFGLNLIVLSHVMPVTFGLFSTLTGVIITMACVEEMQEQITETDDL